MPSETCKHGGARPKKIPQTGDFTVFRRPPGSVIVLKLGASILPKPSHGNQEFASLGALWSPLPGKLLGGVPGYVLDSPRLLEPRNTVQERTAQEKPAQEKPAQEKTAQEKTAPRNAAGEGVAPRRAAREGLRGGAAAGIHKLRHMFCGSRNFAHEVVPKPGLCRIGPFSELEVRRHIPLPPAAEIVVLASPYNCSPNNKQPPRHHRGNKYKRVTCCK